MLLLAAVEGVDVGIMLVLSGNGASVDATTSTPVSCAATRDTVENPFLSDELLELVVVLFDKASLSHRVPLRGPASTEAARKHAQVTRLLTVVARISYCCLFFFFRYVSEFLPSLVILACTSQER